MLFFFFFQAEDGIRDLTVTGVQTCALPIVALATDDEGVSRIDLTHEYVSAVQTYGLSYRDLKQMVRTSLEHTFLSGESLWRAPDNFTRTVSPCAKDSLGTEKPSSACSSFLKSSEKAAQQWELERRFHQFESEL